MLFVSLLRILTMIYGTDTIIFVSVLVITEENGNFREKNI